ncbi:MAG: DUF1573 domain-containing protein [Candidatus Scalindua sp.]
MNKPYFTTILLSMLAVCQFIMCVELQGAEVVHGNDKDSDINVSVQGPTIFFKNPDFNFGQIFKGQKIEHIFEFENRGKDILNIGKVKTSCGCTAAILTNNTILPGNTGEIRTTFNSRSYTGNVTKSISVISNDPERPSYKLTISGEIIEDVSIKPRNIDFGSVYIGEKTNKTVTIKSQTKPDFKIKKITSSKPFINASITEEKNGEYVIKVALENNFEIGRFSGGIYLETNSQIQKKVTIPFFGEIVGDVTTYPKKIYYGFVTRGKELTHKLFVKINKNNIKILSIKTSPDYVSSKIVEKGETDNQHYLIEVRLHAEAAAGKIGGLLELYTNSKIQPVIRIPIMGEIEEG